MPHSSEELRRAGNYCYEDGQRSQNDADKKKHFLKAIEFYNQAIHSAQHGSNDYKSSNKNAFLSYLKICELENNADKVEKYFLEGGKCLSYALQSHFTLIDKTENFDIWAKNIFEVMEEFTDLFFKHATSLDSTSSSRLASKFTLIVRDTKRISSSRHFSPFKQSYDKILSNFFLKQISMLYNFAVVHVSNKEFIKGLELIRTIGPLLHEAAYYNAEKRDLRRKIRETDELDAQAKALKCYNEGNQKLEFALNELEHMNMDYVWAALDHFRECIVENKGENNEITCMAKTKIGIIHYKLFADKHRSKRHFDEVIDYTQVSAHNVKDTDWFKEANKYRDEIISSTPLTNVFIENRADIVMKIKDKTTKLESYESLGHREFCKKIFSEFKVVHIDNISQYEPKANQTEKKIVRNMTLIYHPDKINKEKHGAEYFVLCEEITKSLNRRLEQLVCEHEED